MEYLQKGLRKGKEETPMMTAMMILDRIDRLSR
jgi:hypothetical protein